MTNPTPHGQVPEALRLADELEIPIEGYPEATELERNAAAELRRLHAYCQELEAEIAGGVQALSAAPAGQQVASSAVLKAIREANMQLVRTGDDAFMLVPCKVATTEAVTPKAGATTGATLGRVYAELPAPAAPHGGGPDLFTEGQMRDFADRTHALRQAVIAPELQAEARRRYDAAMEQATPKAAPAPLSERDAFEAWIEKDGGDLGTFGTPPNMHYRNSSVNNAWVAWKARAALAAQGGKDA